jgi:DNA-binding response OmpR family regulator
MTAERRAGSRRALVVDDSEQVRVLIMTGLQRAGYEVDSAPSVRAALDLAPESYDVVLIDMQLGSERGTDLFERIRARDQDAAARCLLMTGGNVSPDLPDHLPVLVKPFRLDELIDTVERLATSSRLPPRS